MTATQTRKVSAKDAAIIAKEYYKEISEDSNSRIQLEEIELDYDDEVWYVTLGIYNSNVSGYELSQGITESTSYKIFTVDPISGEVLSMKIRPLPSR